MHGLVHTSETITLFTVSFYLVSRVPDLCRQFESQNFILKHPAHVGASIPISLLVAACLVKPEFKMLFHMSAICHKPYRIYIHTLQKTSILPLFQVWVIVTLQRSCTQFFAGMNVVCRDISVTYLNRISSKCLPPRKTDWNTGWKLSCLVIN